MTLGLAICVFMVIGGAACLGWLLRWNVVTGDEPVDPREVSRREAARMNAGEAAR